MGAPRILLISPVPPPAGGIATWTKRVLQSALQERFRLRVINVHVGGSTEHSTASLGKIWITLRTLAKLLFHLLFLRPKLVHVNSSVRLAGLYRDGLYLLLARMFFVKTVLHCRNSTFTSLWERKKVRWLTRFFFNRASTIFVLSHKEKRLMNEAGLQHVKQVNNFTVERPKPERDQHHEGPVRFLFVGWIMRRKGIIEIFEGLARLPNTEVTILGRYVDSADEKSADMVAEAIERLGIADRVHLAGEVPYTEVWDYYEKADAFLLPSYLEGFSNALLESMMAALPAVSTPIGAGDEAVVHDETGVVTPVADKEAVYQAMKRLAEDPDLRERMGNAAYQRVMDHYELKSATRALGDRWQEVIGG